MSIALDDRVAAVALRARPGATNRSVRALLAAHGSLRDAAERTLASRALDHAARELERVERLGVRTVSAGDADYPPLLAQTADAPLLLFVWGSLATGDDPAVAIVGSRQASPEGRNIARALGEGLATLGLTVVSGLARGIDGAAHEGALAAGGRTLAVLGCGIDVVYPREHAPLARRVRDSGALISELPPGAEPLPWNFPMRNRVLAGLSRVVVVVEAALKSGSLITARVALDEGRSVVAVPGSPLDPRHQGTNRLIRDGEAALLHALEDVLDEIPRDLRPRREATLPLAPGPALADEEQRVLHALSPSQGRDLDAIAVAAKLEPRRSAVALMELELKGLAERAPGGRYLRMARAETLRVSDDRPELCAAKAMLSSKGSTTR